MKTKKLVLAALFTALTAIGAFIRIPTPISSFTLQFLFTAMAGIILGSGYGALSQLVYLIIGLTGLPVFTMGGGPQYVFQPTFGFLLGLIPAAYIIGKIYEKSKPKYSSMVLACLAGLLALYAVGIPYMYLLLNLYLGRDLSLWSIIKSGMLAFLPFDALKITATAILAAKLEPLTRR